MRTRYAVLIALGCVWLIAAVVVGAATVSLVEESGWSGMPVFGWLMLAVVFCVALPGLAYGGYRWIISANKA
jgi:Na+/H+-dicarboxylate symporter